MNDVIHDGDSHGQRMALALLAALGLHAALFFLPGDWRSLHFPKPRRFEVMILPPVTAPTPSSGNPESAGSAATTFPEPALPPAPEPAQVEPVPAVPLESAQVEPSPPAPEPVPTAASEPAQVTPPPPAPEPVQAQPPPPVPEPAPTALSEPAPATPPPAAQMPILAASPKLAQEPTVPKLAHPLRKPAETVPPKLAVETKPAAKKPPVSPKPPPRNSARPAAPLNPAKPPEKLAAAPQPAKPPEKLAAAPQPAKPPEKLAAAPQPAKPPARPPRPIAQPAPQPAKPAVIPEPTRPPKLPKRPDSGAGSPHALAPGRLDSAALLGQVASIEAETARRETAGVRIKSVSLTDTRSLAGFYVADWARKVTRIGEMNFPDVARRLPLGSGPVLEVVIRADGGLQRVAIKRSSGNAELDQEAKRIVELAAPYPAFSSELRQQYDLLRIESPWRFEPSGRIRAR